MTALLPVARSWLMAGDEAVIVEVSGAQGSVPREAGTRMLVSATRTEGTIGGGHLELKAIEHARGLIERGDTAVSSLHFPLGPALGQCCGGAVTLRFERLDARQLDRWPAARELFHLQLYGAGHVGRAVARLLADLPVTVQWLDERQEEFPLSLGAGWPPHIQVLAGEGIEDEVKRAPAGAFYLVMTHRHDLDLRITEAILRRNDFAFFGLIGSKTKKQRFIHRLEERGVPQAAIDRMVCPIGLPGITGKEPEVIAVAVVAQLLRQASGRVAR